MNLVKSSRNKTSKIYFNSSQLVLDLTNWLHGKCFNHEHHTGIKFDKDRNKYQKIKLIKKGNRIPVIAFQSKLMCLY
jgi:hypothetical protein